MNSLITSNIGSFPRVGEEKDHQRFRRGYGHFERKEISAHGFRDVQQSVIQELIREQENCLVDEVTDGLVCWEDPISHFCKNLTGIERTGLTRYFETNFYYRKPCIVSKPRLLGTTIAGEYEFAKNVTRKTVRAILTGPYTLATHTGATQKNYGKLKTRLDFFTDVIAEEVAALAGVNAPIIQIDEPSLAANPSDFPLVKKSLEKISACKSGSKIVLALYYFPLTRLWSQLQSLPMNGLNLDCTNDGPALFKKMENSPGQMDIGLGLFNSLNTKLESIDELAPLVRRWVEASSSSTTTRLTPSSGLELIPRASALAKLSLLNKLKIAVELPQPTVLS